MRRWNGWGDESVAYSIPGPAISFLERLIGTGHHPQDVDLQEAVSGVPKSRLPRNACASSDPFTRLLHARGQSFPDWVALRTGQITSYPDGVAFPMSNNEVRELIQSAKKSNVHLIPYGGGTSVCGHIDPEASKRPVISVDMSHMSRLIDLQSQNLLARFEAGIFGPDLEARLRAHGFTLGHYPQSFEYSTLGGWVSTRSSGQQSLRYGSIEKMFAGGRLESPCGEWIMPSFPASAAGPDLREIVLGAEGRLGILTEAVVRISPLPEHEEFHAVFFPDFLHGIDAVKQILTAGLSLSMLRLSTAKETATTLALAGHENLIGALEGLLSLRGLGKDKCMLLLGFSGRSASVRSDRGEALNLTAKHGGVHVGKTFGEQWHKARFRTPYLRNSLWDIGYGVDTLETAIEWSEVARMVKEIETSVDSAAAMFNEKVHIFTHLSHVYPTGSSIYTTLIFRLSTDMDKTVEYWQAMKSAACQAILALGGTISHHHGVGTEHATYLASEKGVLGISAISAVCHQFDPKGIMNPGKLVN